MFYFKNVANCALVTAPTNGVISNTADPLISGASQTITCNSGFTADGPTSGTCTNGVWGPDITATSCPGRLFVIFSLHF